MCNTLRLTCEAVPDSYLQSGTKVAETLPESKLSPFKCNLPNLHSSHFAPSPLPPCQCCNDVTAPPKPVSTLILGWGDFWRKRCFFYQRKYGSCFENVRFAKMSQHVCLWLWIFATQDSSIGRLLLPQALDGVNTTRVKFMLVMEWWAQFRADEKFWCVKTRSSAAIRRRFVGGHWEIVD